MRRIIKRGFIQKNQILVRRPAANVETAGALARTRNSGKQRYRFDNVNFAQNHRNFFNSGRGKGIGAHLRAANVQSFVICFNYNFVQTFGIRC